MAGGSLREHLDANCCTASSIHTESPIVCYICRGDCNNTFSIARNSAGKAFFPLMEGAQRDNFLLALFQIVSIFSFNYYYYYYIIFLL